jgi:hypothetical protein
VSAEAEEWKGLAEAVEFEAIETSEEFAGTVVFVAAECGA